MYKDSRLESYMHFPAPQISLAVLLLHMMFGCCCWHHAHTCAMDCRSYPAATAEVCPCDAHHEEHSADNNLCHHDQKDDGAPRREHHSKPHQCTGGLCTFLRTEQSPEQNAKVSGGFLTIDALALNREELTSAKTLTTAIAHRVWSDIPPLRRHLLLSVLLI